MTKLPPQPTAKDTAVYNNIRQQLMNNQITDRDVYEMLKKGAFTPGTQTLLYDIIDFGHHQADDEYQAFLNGYKIPG